MLDYEKEQKRIENEVWSSINVKNLRVIDFGIGEDAVSTKKLIELGAKVIAIDNDMDKLKKCRYMNIQLIKCDISHLPFNKKISDLALFYFTLHEIDPKLHEKIISDVSMISSKVMIVEPSPEGCRAYKLYEKIWHDAMQSINRFEIYRSLSYWEALIRRCGFKVALSKKISQDAKIPPALLESIVWETIKNWKKLSIENEYIDKMKDFLNYTQKNGMKWSDLILVIGEMV